MTRIQSQGRTYDDSTDFLAELRAATANGGASWLRYDLPSLGAAICDWAEPILSSPLAPQLADATLTFIETAPMNLAGEVTGLPWQDAPRAIERALDLLAREPKRFGSHPRSVPSVFWKLLQKTPQDPRLLGALRREAAKADADDWTRELAVEFKA